MIVSIEEIRERLSRGVIKLHKGDFVPMTDAALWISNSLGNNLALEIFDGAALLRSELGESPAPAHYLVEDWEAAEEDEDTGFRHGGRDEYVSLDFLRAVAFRHGNVALAKLIDDFNGLRDAVGRREIVGPSRDESDEDRQRRRFERFHELGGKLTRVGGGWRCGGQGAPLKRLAQEEAGKPGITYRDERDVSDDLKTEADRRRLARTVPRLG